MTTTTFAQTPTCSVAAANAAVDAMRLYLRDNDIEIQWGDECAVHEAITELLDKMAINHSVD